MRSELLTGTRHFLGWWLRELRACVPTTLSEAVFGSRDRLELEIGEDDAALLLVGERRRRELGRLPVDPADLAASAKRTRRLVRRSGLGDRSTTVRMPPGRVLLPRIELPVAAAENLPEALAFEMDRHSPFAADDVFFDFRVAGTDPEMQRVQVDLAIARKQDVMEALEIARGLGLVPARVAGPDEPGPGFNLLPPELRVRRRRWLPRLTAGMALLTIVLVLVVIGTWIERKERLLARTEERLAELRALAGEAANRQERLDRLVTLSKVVTEERQRRPLAIEVIDDISGRMPDRHWLVSYSVRDGTLQVSGFSEDPSALLRLLEESDLLSDARFAAPVTSDPETGKETFSVVATLAGAEGGE